MRYLNMISKNRTTVLVVGVLLVAFVLAMIPAYAAVKVVLKDTGLFSTAGASITSSGAGWAVKGNTTVTGTLTSTGGYTPTGNILPSANDTYGLGSSSKQWSKAWVAKSLYSPELDTGVVQQMYIGRNLCSLVNIEPMVKLTRTLKFSEYSNGPAGVATLNGSGWVTVSNSAVDDNTRILLTGQSTTGACYVKSRSSGVSFNIYSTDASDSGVVYWELRKN